MGEDVKDARQENKSQLQQEEMKLLNERGRGLPRCTHVNDHDTEYTKYASKAKRKNEEESVCARA